MKNRQIRQKVSFKFLLTFALILALFSGQLIAGNVSTAYATDDETDPSPSESGVVVESASDTVSVSGEDANDLSETGSDETPDVNDEDSTSEETEDDTSASAQTQEDASAQHQGGSDESVHTASGEEQKEQSSDETQQINDNKEDEQEETVEEEEVSEDQEEDEEEEETDEELPNVIAVGGFWFELDHENKEATLYGGSVAEIGAKADIPARFALADGTVYTTTAIKAWTLYQTSFDSIVIPDTVRSVGYCAFYQANIGGTLVIPDSVTEISDYAFHGGNYDRIVIGKGLSSIPYAFAYNKKSYELEINSDSLKNLDGFAFYCKREEGISISKLTVHGSNADAISDLLAANGTLKSAQLISRPDCNDSLSLGVDGMLFELNEKDNTAVLSGFVYTGQTRVSVPATVETAEQTYAVTGIADEAFSAIRHTFIRTPSFSEGLKTIGARALTNTQQMYASSALVIPHSVTSIGEEAFANDYFDIVTFGRGLESVGSRAFANLQGDGHVQSKDPVTGEWISNAQLIFHCEDGHVPVIAADAFDGAHISTISVYGPEGCLDDLVESIPAFKGIRPLYVDSEDHHGTTRFFETVTDDGVRVTVEVSSASALPDDARLVVTKVTQGGEGYAYDAYLAALNRHKSWLIADESIPFSDENTLLYDVAFIGTPIDSDGKYTSTEQSEIQPGQVTLTFHFENKQLSEQLNIQDAGDVLIVHLPLRQEVKGETYTTAALTALSEQDIRTQQVRAYSVNVQNGDFTRFTLSSLSLISFTGKKAFEIGETERSLQELIDSSEDGIVVVGANTLVEETVVVEAGKQITLTTEEGAELVTILADEGVAPLFQIEKGAELVIDGNLNIVADDSKACQTTVAENKGTLTIGNGKIQGGKIASTEGAAIRVRDGAHLVMNGGSLENTTATGTLRLSAPVLVEAGGTFDMDGGLIGSNRIVPSSLARFVDTDGITKDSDPLSPGGVLLYGRLGKKAVMTLSGGELSGNTAYSGGAIMTVGLSELTMTGGEISGNFATTQGGGIAIAGPVLGGGVNDAVFTLDGGVISGNKAQRTGGGIYINTSAALLKSGRIEYNETNGHGGGVYVSTVPYLLQMENVLVTGNYASGQGGGVWLCPTGSARFFADHGVAIFDNKAGGAADDFASNGGGGKDMEVHLDRRVLGGGLVFYYQDGGFYPSVILGANGVASVNGSIPRYNAQDPGDIVHTEGTKNDLALKAVMSNAAKQAARNNAKLIITNNTAAQGGGIGSNGSMKITGEEPKYWELEVLKVWDQVEDNRMPASITIELLLQDLPDAGSESEKEYLVADTIELNAENNWKGSFGNLLETERGHVLVREKDAAENGFIASYGEIVEKDGKLTIEITNRVPEEEEEEPVTTPDSVRFRAKKYVNNARPEQTFIFVLTDANSNVLQRKTNNGTDITFDSIRYDKEGTYVYHLYEEKGSDPRMTYDPSVYTATVTVRAEKDAAGNTTLRASVSWTKAGQTVSGDPVFHNTYTPPEEPETPVEPPEVLGARRTDSEGVLGARRAKTGDMSRTTNVAALAAALAGLAALLLKKKPDDAEDNE